MNFQVILFGLGGVLLAMQIFVGMGSNNIYAITIKIESPLTGQQVPAGELAISGTSSDNSTSDCQVYVDWNNLKPYQLATPTGLNGSGDFSMWNFTYTSNYHLIQTGLNELTSKITCLVTPKGPTLSKWYSINVTGIASANQSKDVQLPLPTANIKSQDSNLQDQSPQSEPLDGRTSVSNYNKINLDISVENNPISAGDRQTVTVIASDPQTDETIDRVFLHLTIKDPSGNVVKDYTDTRGEISHSFILDEEITGTFTVQAIVSKEGDRTEKSATFIVH
ncbi:MAG TPA: hypothetical protein VLD84_09420 [Nitrososphaeraceae archaeon]|nr:hypothetical protein [Nitrososphaeraceae archaeon]